MLQGIKGISLTHYLQGPSCVQYLADLGADVTKIEKIGGAYERHWSGAESYVDDQSVFYLLAGRNQKSIELNMKDPRGAKILWDLLAESDVLVEKFRPGALDRLGFTAEAIAAHNPRLIFCSLSGFGSRGPLAGEPGQDLLIQSISGLMDLTGPANSAPTPVGTAIVDQHGATLGALGIPAALFRREKTGQGCRVDASLLAAALNLQIEPLSYYLNGTELYPKSANSLGSRFHQAPYGAYETADGWITISLSASEALAKGLGITELAGLTREDQFRDRERISSLVADALRGSSTAAWLEELPKLGIWCAPIQGYDAIVDHPQVLANDSFLSTTLANGATAKLLAHPISYDGQVPGIHTAPPLAGEHTSEVLDSLGYTQEQIDALLAEGAVGASSQLGSVPK